MQEYNVIYCLCLKSEFVGDSVDIRFTHIDLLKTNETKKLYNRVWLKINKIGLLKLYITLMVCPIF